MYQCVSGNVSNVGRQIPFSCVEEYRLVVLKTM